jgi:hypothetical protein
VYPRGKALVLGSLGKEEVSLYEGKVAIPVRITLSSQAKGPKQRLTFRLSYQACNDKVCLAPARLAIPLDVTLDTPSAAGPGARP